MSPKDLAALNASLHQRIQDAVSSGAAVSTGGAEAPQGVSFVDLLESNARAGLPLLSGAKAYRGSKDPDVDAGTFEAGFKHATPVFDLAIGYATTANHHMGLRCKASAGIGALAEYDLPADAVFHRNFGMEDAAKENVVAQAVKPLSVQEAEAGLAPLAAAYVSAVDRMGRGSEAAASVRADILTFAKSNLYEIALPAAAPARRSWVVVDDGLHGVTFVGFDPQAQGPLASVMVDVVKARKATVDEHVASQVLALLAQGGSAGFEESEAFAQGLGQAMRGSAAAIEETLAQRRAAADATPLPTLAAALAWRKEAQSGMVLERLSNSGSQVLHDSPDLAPMPALIDAMDDIALAAHHLRRRPQQKQALSLLAAAAENSAALAELRPQHEAAKAAAQHAAEKLDGRQRALSDASDNLEKLENEKNGRLSAGWVSRTLRRLSGESKKASASILAQEARVADRENAMEHQAYRSGQADKEREQLRAQIERLAGELSQNEKGLRSLRSNGDLFFMPDNFLATPGAPAESVWPRMHGVAKEFVAKADADIGRALRAANLFKSIAKHGVAKGYEAAKADSLDLASTAPGAGETALQEQALSLQSAAAKTAAELAKIQPEHEAAKAAAQDAADKLEIRQRALRNASDNLKKLDAARNGKLAGGWGARALYRLSGESKKADAAILAQEVRVADLENGFERQSYLNEQAAKEQELLRAQIERLAGDLSAQEASLSALGLPGERAPSASREPIAERAAESVADKAREIGQTGSPSLPKASREAQAGGGAPRAALAGGEANGSESAAGLAELSEAQNAQAFAARLRERRLAQANANAGQEPAPQSGRALSF
jgi:hypothetical protein